MHVIFVYFDFIDFFLVPGNFLFVIAGDSCYDIQKYIIRMAAESEICGEGDAKHSQVYINRIRETEF